MPFPLCCSTDLHHISEIILILFGQSESFDLKDLKASQIIFSNKLLDVELKQCTHYNWEGNRNKRLSFISSATRVRE